MMSTHVRGKSSVPKDACHWKLVYAPTPPPPHAMNTAERTGSLLSSPAGTTTISAMLTGLDHLEDKDRTRWRVSLKWNRRMGNGESHTRALCRTKVRTERLPSRKCQTHRGPVLTLKPINSLPGLRWDFPLFTPRLKYSLPQTAMASPVAFCGIQCFKLWFLCYSPTNSISGHLNFPQFTSLFTLPHWNDKPLETTCEPVASSTGLPRFLPVRPYGSAEEVSVLGILEL